MTTGTQTQAAPDHASTAADPRAWSGPRVLLHLEGAALLVATLVVYYAQGWGWGWFFLLLLAPDLSFVAYLVNTRVGAWVYNVVHLTMLPLALFGLGAVADSGIAQQVAIVWLAHIFMDRMVGYGFKYPTAFKDTHLQRV